MATGITGKKEENVGKLGFVAGSVCWTGKGWERIGSSGDEKPGTEINGKSIHDEREAHLVGERARIEARMVTELSEGGAEIDKEGQNGAVPSSSTRPCRVDSAHKLVCWSS